MHEGYLKKKRLIPILLWQSGAFESATASMFCYKLKYLLLTVQMRSFACNVCVCEGNRVTSQRSILPVRNHLNHGLCTANTYEHHHCVCHATLFSSRAWTDKTNLKAEARDNRKGRYISDTCLWCSANHNALGQLANQSRLHLSERGTL